MNPQEKFELIKRRTQEIISEEDLQKLLHDKKQPAVYLGWSITGRPHIAYYVPVLKLADFLKAWDVLEKRYQYYAATIPLMFKSIGADIRNFEIVKGSSFQLKQEYFVDLLKLASFTSIHDATKAASEVVKLGDNPKLGGIIYPLMQALDEEYLDVDVQYGGVDQRKILMYAREFLPKLGYKPRVEVMTPLIPGLMGGTKKMSASDPKSKIDLLDDPFTVNQKLKNAYAVEGEVEGNGLLAFLKSVIMVLKTDEGKNFVVERPEKFGGNLSFNSYEEVEEAYAQKKLHPLDLKQAIAKEINLLLETFQKEKAMLEKLAEGYV
ncbi:tyrosine--tRNA ligase [Candidatus Woesearchaeota archaeon]|nr:tyrosine--tRNA ligase [Candidatus Woesearchaeota archaeon]